MMWEECRKDDLEEKTKHIRLIPFFLCAESEKGVNILPEPEILCAVNHIRVFSTIYGVRLQDVVVNLNCAALTDSGCDGRVFSPVDDSAVALR
ncbi:hypothetical protein F2P81_019305 [Scophthalmus maximus]|uniref:Uncharacterized protein n=1 Tax=Scophthalmus maximus TaxID=52904 RepID=A0A6A4S7L3_SCOMX|nr:hypothetical protein F2P81_019305 [Scophthalmus maximus]